MRCERVSDICSYIPEVYVGKGYGGAIALGDIPMRGANMLPRFDD